jgi:DNA-binding response OmpR family regulator
MPSIDAVLLDLDTIASPFVQVREIRAAVGVRVLLACSKKELGVEVVLAYEAGADDYFAKSLDLVVIEAKVRRAIERRHGRADSGVDAACIAPSESQRALLRNVDGDLTRFEYRLLHLLAKEPKGLVPQFAILQQLWGRTASSPKLLYEHISTLRCKIAAWGWTITNIRGKGYRLEPLPRCMQSAARAGDEPAVYSERN